MSESDPALRRVPSLVSYCQRAITCLGDDIRYDVIRPVLECCSADTLLRLEQSSPYLEQDTSDLWERLCFKSYPLLAEQLARNGDPQPEPWRDQYFLLREAEAHRLEEAASRLRNQRMEAAERKKEREVKLTDKLPPAKRARAWGTSSQPRSLFQKTKNEATKLRRTLYTPRLPPQIPHSKVHRPEITNPLVVSSTKPVNGRVAVKTVTVTRPSTSLPQTTPPRPVQSTNAEDRVSKDLSPPKLPSSHPPSQPTDPRPSKPQIQKRDPMASLFMPKHRALSQLPSQAGNNNRSVPAR
ncbi:RNA polymerase II transcription factor SIII subunit A-domain-containing protein [Boletus edulis]|uniref:RNA polymerase II transcription factor SIII subunit A-domain-containing protein n=1 Tax=Boletus edulis BED1 TaxID=1328754 RepID=A0AAD4C421_BOLED|nr:RNA polymerase II transcription factor SIII subunit A-domain-containing protein [Boletus edulis]KAF8447856.1 RNA polymerase II transcription factor SIII subunit A-domain-containing protein [Boletus edulis BED1]